MNISERRSPSAGSSAGFSRGTHATVLSLLDTAEGNLAAGNLGAVKHLLRRIRMTVNGDTEDRDVG